MTQQFGYQGTQTPGDSTNDFTALSFLVNQILATISTVTLVKIVTVTNNGGVSPVGFVDVQPLVNQTDGAGNATPHGVVYGLPYFRLQGGTNAIILDPQVGDIGMCGFASRDISSVKASKAQANPGSGRVFDMADGIYFGGFLNGTPTQYVQFSASGINVVSPTKVTITAPNIECDASTAFAVNSPIITLNGALNQGSGSYAGNATLGGSLDAAIDVTSGAISLRNHKTSGVTPGSGTSGVPVP